MWNANAYKTKVAIHIFTSIDVTHYFSVEICSSVNTLFRNSKGKIKGIQTQTSNEI
jgi:hypothetical protein